MWKLFEDRQIFKDGRERKRNYPWSVTEKPKNGETPEETLERGVRQEELKGIIGPFRSLTKRSETRRVKRKSNSYPGLTSNYLVHIFDIELTEDQFRPEGYVTHEPNLTTYFVWKNVK